MNLYLVQHAEAKSKEEDPERPLSERGRSDIERVARFVAGQPDIEVSAILHSGKTRAVQTAEALARALSPPEGVRETDGLDALAEPSIWAGRIARVGEGLMLVGHLPHLRGLAALLLCQDADRRVVEFEMGGIVCLGRDDSGVWSVRWMVVPRLLA